MGPILGSPLTMDVYQAGAATTAVYPKEIGLEYVVMGLAGEAGEIACQTPSKDPLIRATLGLAAAAGLIANQVKKVYRDNDGDVTPERRHAIQNYISTLAAFLDELCRETETDTMTLGPKCFDIPDEMYPDMREVLIRELGDAEWYGARVATELQISLERVCARNLVMLQARLEAGTLKGDNRESETGKNG